MVDTKGQEGTKQSFSFLFFSHSLGRNAIQRNKFHECLITKDALYSFCERYTCIHTHKCNISHDFHLLGKRFFFLPSFIFFPLFSLSLLGISKQFNQRKSDEGNKRRKTCFVSYFLCSYPNSFSSSDPPPRNYRFTVRISSISSLNLSAIDCQLPFIITSFLSFSASLSATACSQLQHKVYLRFQYSVFIWHQVASRLFFFLDCHFNLKVKYVDMWQSRY